MKVRSRVPGALVTGVALVTIASLTLYPVPETRALPLFCIICGQFGGVDFVLNIALFVPLGVGCALLGFSARTSLLIGFVVTLVIEGLQWRVISGRDASFGDLLANSTGALLGAWLVPVAARWIRVTGRDAIPVLRASAIMVAAIIMGSAFFLAPAPPPDRQWVLWTASRPYMDPFPGTLRRASVNGREVIGGDPIPPGLLAAGTHRETRIEAVASGVGGNTRRKAHIIASATPTLEEGFFLGQWKDAVIFRTYTIGSGFRLRPLLGRLPVALAVHPRAADSTAVITATSDRRAITVAVDRERRYESVLRRTVGLAWTLLLPWDIAIDAAWWPAIVLFVGVLVLPVGYLASRARHPGTPDEAGTWQPLWPLLLVLASIALAPFIAGIAASGVAEWSGAIAGILIGAVAGMVVGIRATT